MNIESQRIRIGAVSYLNTVPLVYGMQHGTERDAVELTFSLPSVCAERVAAGAVDVGLVPVAEIGRQQLESVPGVGIAARGAVRSILLFSRVPWRQVRTLAADSSSRTSVELARVIVRERFGAAPAVLPFEPDLDVMMDAADAALIIGDPALRIDPANTPYDCLDLAAEWFDLTHLPFIFALWAGKPRIPVSRLHGITESSYQFGRTHIRNIARQEAVRRNLPEELALRYLQHHLRYEIGSEELAGLEAFFTLAGLARVHV